jgi:hypothetical protein
VGLLTEFPATSDAVVVVVVIVVDIEARRIEAPNDGRTLLRIQAHRGHQRQASHLPIDPRRLYCM